MEKSILLIMISVGFSAIVTYVVYSYNQKKKFINSPELQNELLLIEKFLQAIHTARQDYFRNTHKEELRREYQALHQKFTSKAYRVVSGNPVVSELLKIYANFDIFVKQWNDEFVVKQLAVNKALFDNIEGKSLDDQQRKAVVVDEDNNLVLAGAGTGKTLTITAKVKYLVEKKNTNPDEILLISYTRKAADEMQKRISKLNINVKAMTFHKLGLEIITKHRDNRPDVFVQLDQIIDRYFKSDISGNTQVMRNLVEFFGYYLNIPKELEEFDNLGEAFDYNKNCDFETLKSKFELRVKSIGKNRRTIQGETVKSLEEVMIANFLYLHGVTYQYENIYPFQVGDRHRKQYRPDFYLADYDIYIEHFGINKDRKAPWLSQIEEKKYLADMDWKRSVHKKNRTPLIETFSYQNSTGELLRALDSQLRINGVRYHDVDLIEIYNQVFTQEEDMYFKEFKKLIQTFIELFKSRGFTESEFDNLNKIALGYNNKFLRQRTVLFLSIVKPVFVRYQTYLKNSGEIDFNDMINQATDIIKHGQISKSYKYIIIDEYQDISVSRYKLINELKRQTNAKVMVVGDDWQSIYRFAGSDIDLFTEFKKYFGFTETLKIERTYRNSQELVDIAGKFVMNNPKQLKKNLISDKHNSSPVKMFGYDKEKHKAIKLAIDYIVQQFGPKTEIFLLGRTRYDIEVLEGIDDFTVVKSQSNVTVKYKSYPDLRISFLTVHSAKGLESENTIIINLENSLLGFPNKIADDPVLSLVLTDLDDYDYAEERRLFYVALTRTKNYTYLIVPDHNPSVFADELRNKQNIRYYIASGESTIQNNPNCPVCKKGYLVLRENGDNGSKFLGCSNYPQCEKTLNNVELLNGYMKCDQCGGYMVQRNGTHGDFYGCTNYPDCSNTVNIYHQ